MKSTIFGLPRRGLDHGLEPLLEIAAKTGARQQRAHVERENLHVLERGGHVAVMDREREPLGERGLAHARLADEHRIVLAPAQQDMNRALDLVLAPDQRIDLSLCRALGEVYRVGLERACRREFRRTLLVVVALAFFVSFSSSLSACALVGAAHCRDLHRRHFWTRRAK